jgi:hypothetical protein
VIAVYVLRLAKKSRYDAFADGTATHDAMKLK